MKLFLILFFACSFIVLAGQTNETIITNVNIVSMENGTVLQGKSIVVRGSTIDQIVSNENLTVPKNATVIDANNGYLIPGLIDMHVHVEHSSELTLYPAYGVTSVYNLAGYPRHLRWKKAIANGELFGPQLFSTGDYIDGYPATFETMMGTTTPEDAARLVQLQRIQGYDAIKVYSRMQPEQLTAVATKAAEYGMAVFGHSGPNYDLDFLLNSGQTVITHGEEVTRYIGVNPSDEVIATTADKIAKSGVWLIPNLVLVDHMGKGWKDVKSINGLEVANYMHPAVFQQWKARNNRFVKRNEKWYQDQLKEIATLQKLTKQIAEKGGNLLAGTDASTIFAYPGYGLLEELELMVEGGLSPLKALQTATSNCGAFLQQYSRPDLNVGYVKEGYRADLLLLEENPLEDIKAIYKRSGVLLNGVWYNANQMKEKLNILASTFNAIRPIADQFEMAILQGDYEKARALWDDFRITDQEPLLAQHYWFFYLGFRWVYEGRDFTTDQDKLDKALKHFILYTEMYPEYHRGFQMLARVYCARGEYQKSLEAIEKADRIHPYNPYTQSIKELVVEKRAKVPVEIQIDPGHTITTGTPIEICVTGLEPKDTVSVSAYMKVGSRKYTSSATYKADAEGTIDLRRAAPIKGSYKGADVSGLFWSMNADENHQIPEDLVPYDIGKSTVRLEVNRKGNVIAKTDHTQYNFAPNIRKVDLDWEGVVAELYTPLTGGARPAIIALSDSGGGLQTRLAKTLAAEGYTVLALSYFKSEGLPQHLAEIPLEYIEKATRTLLKHPTVLGNKAAIIGGSKGGELALLMAAYYPDLYNACIAIVPSSVVWQDIGAEGTLSSWTKDGKPLPFVPYSGIEQFKKTGLLVDLYRNSLHEYGQKEAIIPVENIKGALLMISGELDNMWPSAKMTRQVEARLKKNNFSYPLINLIYPKAGHEVFGSGWWPYTSSKSMGGMQAGNARAKKESWPIVIKFLKDNL
ncbi:MAG: acyl-CoA thioester hydrolase/BAAT C-terminal domain-containing protein [Bacteroidota bacterium]